MSKTIRMIMLAIAVVATPMLAFPSEASAGPLLDWIRGVRKPRCNTGCATPSFASAAPNAYGLQPGQCMQTCEQTCSRTVVSYVPHTAYRTNWTKVPVTTYKPVTNSDPCTGCTVTCMRPCTTYTYQMQRVPYTTYRPVYNTETYKVPVTTITNDCATGNCASGTCGTGAYPYPGGGMPMSPPMNYAPMPTNTGVPQNYLPTETVNGTYYEYPTSTTAPGSYSSSPQPADIAPSLQGVSPQSFNRPVLDQLRNVQPDFSTQNPRPATYQPTPTPSVISYNETARVSAPERREWSYSPVRLASYQSDEVISSPQPIQIRGTFNPGRNDSVSQNSNNFQSSNNLNGWVEVE